MATRKKIGDKFTLIMYLTICVFFLVIFSSSIFAESYVVVNSRDWHDLYLGTVYAGLTNQSIIAFSNLGEAQTKSKLIAPDSQVLIIEPTKNSVVKRYSSYLSANGVTKTNTLSYDDFIDLQSQFVQLLEKTPNQPINGYAILYAPFGVEAVNIVPILYEKSYMPLFVDELHSSSFFTAIQNYKSRPALLAGHLPVRIVSDLKREFNVNKMYVNDVEENSAQIVGDVLKTSKSNMGVISRIDRIDLQAIKRGLPQFVYFGDTQEVATQISKSNIDIFEVISSDAADLSKSISALSGRNLKLLVKYARGFTNIQGLSGQLLDLDTVEFPYQFTYVTVEKAVYHEQESTLTVTLKNSGTIPSRLYSTIEFGQATYADEISQIIPAQSSITFPYVVENAPSNNRVVINTLYGKNEPLTKTILGSKGEPLVVIDAIRDTTKDNSDISFVASRIDETNGQLQLDIQNNADKPVIVSAQVILDNVTLVSSSQTQLRANQLGQILVPIPYISANDLLEKPLTLTFAYGEVDTLKTKSISFAVKEIIYPQKNSIPMWLIITISIILLLFVALIILLRLRKNVG